MQPYKTHPYYTHQPYLTEVCKFVNGNILECGCGEGSTILLKQLIQNTNRKLVSLESNLEWLNEYTHLADSSHTFYHIDANNDDVMETGNKWVKYIADKQLNDFDIVFIDSSPWLSRKCCFDYFLNKAKVIVVHDFDYFPLHNIIGNITYTENKEYNGKRITKHHCNLDNVVKNYRLFHPPEDFFAGDTGPPTLVCSNTMDDDEFQSLIQTIEYSLPSYYN